VEDYIQINTKKDNIEHFDVKHSKPHTLLKNPKNQIS